jgi:hypothetical protein
MTTGCTYLGGKAPGLKFCMRPKMPILLKLDQLHVDLNFGL